MSAYERAIELSSEIEMTESRIKIGEEKATRLEGERAERNAQKLEELKARLPELVAAFIAEEKAHGKTIVVDSPAIRAARG